MPICSIDVPMPWDTRPPQRFSLKLITAKPTICAQHPATAAPPASPVRESAAQIAALEMGSVRAMPTTTDTRIPIRNGCSSVAHIMKMPTELAIFPIPGASREARTTPVKIVTNGVTSRSTLVSLDTILPISAARMAITSTARGPPAPPSVLAAPPTAASENSTRLGAFRA